MMSKFTGIPQFVKDAFNEHCTGVPGAIIAGGAVRDTLNGVWIKDIDIFVDAQHAHHYKGVIQKWHKTGKKSSKLFDWRGEPLLWQPPKATNTASMRIPYQSTAGGNNVHLHGMKGTVSFHTTIPTNLIEGAVFDPYESNNKIVEVYELSEKFPLNLIFTECSPKEYVTKYFDYGICKAWYDGTFVHMHGDYTTDVNNKTITMVLPEEHVIACYGSVEAGIHAMQEHANRLQHKYPNFKVVMPSV